MFLSISYLVYFYFLLLILSIIFFPISFSILKSVYDRGFAITKLLGVIIPAFIVWFICSLFGFSFTIPLIYFVFFLITITSAYLFLKQKSEILIFIKAHKNQLIFEELIFLLLFGAFILIRFGNPDLWHPVMGGEKPMDFSFINSIVRSQKMPPYDPWFAGANINYYYFGQFITAFFVKATHIPSAYLYNIFLAYLFSQSGLVIYSILYSFTKLKRASMLGPLLLLGVGNLGQVAVIYNNFLDHIPINGWYWTATRIMPNGEINEFPYFTFLYADLHSHLISLPLVLLFILVCYQIYKNVDFKINLLHSVFAGLLLGLLRFTNIWDFPTFLTFFAIVIFGKLIFTQKGQLLKNSFKNLILLITTSGFSYLFVLPFIIEYKTGPLGLSFYGGPYTEISDYLIINGLFVFILVTYSINFIFNFSVKKTNRFLRLIFLVPFSIFVYSLLAKEYTLSLLSIILFLQTLILLSKRTSKTEKFIILISIFAFFLTAIPDIFDLKLGLGRMNTVFKFYFQAWILFAITSSYFIVKTYKNISNKKLFLNIYLSALVTLIACASIYIPTSTIAKVEDRMADKNFHSLDGQEYMKYSTYNDLNENIKLIYDYLAIQFINKNITDNGVLLEATTPIYKWGSRISVNTGLPTILGWDWHETAHRQYLPLQSIEMRKYDIQQTYESNDFNYTKKLLNKYKVKYIYLGKLEKIYYDTKGFEKVAETNKSHFKKIYSNAQVKIYMYTK